ncbi:hypothetical protein [Endozoicomonas sp. GU-1]|uniref:hypothetical protein n=1 Tax=Endozoicomonas sp. GU-1 TaxID=3009078 RepID=UPI0022B323A3|nr:hypothetical protein [Endozoicomonas sp. GU-1]WBA81189.1 hypothetical protein O2T12_23315 [Endozoicomonas sp. GU-1]WBA84138.1 hypothetical protein O3276_12500 [Endozoicomonas sp. GU-1]
MNRFQFLLISVFSGLLGWNADVSAESLEEALGLALRSNPQAKVALSRLKAERKISMQSLPISGQRLILRPVSANSKRIPVQILMGTSSPARKLHFP